MKRFLAGAVIGFLMLSVAGVVLATDYEWRGSSGNSWHTNGNWNAVGYPGGGTPARIGDRAIIADGVNMPLTFSSSSGASPVSGVNENRAIQDLYLIGNGEGNKEYEALVALLVTGDTLYVRHVFMNSGSSAGKQAAIKVTADNAFKPEIMNLTGTANSRVELIIEKDVLVETETRVTGNVNIRVTDGYFYFTNFLIINQGKITSDSTFSFPSS